MKLKGISTLEQNVDRIVLGVVGLTFVGAIGLQFLPEKEVKVGSSAKMSKPTQAMGVVEDEARAVAGKLDSMGLATPEVPAFTLTERLALGAGAPTPASKIARAPLGRPPQFGQITVNARQENDLFALPTLPAPTGGAAAIVQGTISPVEKIKNADLAKLLPDAQPFDKTAVSVEFGWSGAQLREALQSDPDGEGPAAPMPLNWWRDQAGGRNLDLVDIVAVQYERETLRKADGTTPADAERVVVLAAPPGRASKLEEWKNTVKGAADVSQVMLPAVQEAAEEIQRPHYYSMIAGAEWLPPAKAQGAGNADSKVVENNRDRASVSNLDRRIADLEKKLQEAGAATTRKEERPDAPPTRTGGGKSGGSQAPTPAPTNAEKKSQTGDPRVLKQQLDRAIAEREAILKRLADRGERVDGTDAQAETFIATLDNPDVRVWTHDMTAEPGAVYKYRARVVVNNPLFGRNLQAKQADLAAQNLLEGPWSEWTSEIVIPRSSYFFITSAAEANAQFSPQPTAGAELYVFKYGYYRKASVQLNPGDSLFGEARMPKTLKYADMERLKTLLEDPAAANPAGGAPVPPPPGGKGGGALAPGHVPPPAAPGVDPALAGPLDQVLTKPVPEREPIAMDVTFLDASPLPATVQRELGGQQIVMQVSFRDEHGRILVTSPDVAGKDPMYDHVSKSAKAGETQGAPIVKPEDAPKPPKPLQEPRRGGERPPPPPGGGGGG
jgi:hypothetical protein